MQLSLPSPFCSQFQFLGEEVLNLLFPGIIPFSNPLSPFSEGVGWNIKLILNAFPRTARTYPVVKIQKLFVMFAVIYLANSRSILASSFSGLWTQSGILTHCLHHPGQKALYIFGQCNNSDIRRLKKRRMEWWQMEYSVIETPRIKKCVTKKCFDLILVFLLCG